MAQSGKTLHSFGAIDVDSPISNSENVTVTENGTVLVANRDNLCINSTPGVTVPAITGLIMADGRDGQLLTIMNKSERVLSFDITGEMNPNPDLIVANFIYQDGLNESIDPGSVISLMYDGTAKIWRYHAGKMVAY